MQDGMLVLEAQGGAVSVLYKFLRGWGEESGRSHDPALSSAWAVGKASWE